MLLQSTDKEALPRRTGATECLGLIAEALGKDLMGPLVPGIMEAAFQVGAGFAGYSWLALRIVNGRTCSPGAAACGTIVPRPRLWCALTASAERVWIMELSC